MAWSGPSHQLLQPWQQCCQQQGAQQQQRVQQLLRSRWRSSSSWLTEAAVSWGQIWP
jgi:hypothetical protein